LYPPFGCSQIIGELEISSGYTLKIGGQSLLPDAARELEVGASLNVTLKDI
jgi:hypothetical protein